MANTRCRLLAPPHFTSPGFQPIGRRSGEGSESVLEQLQNDPARRATEPPVEGHPQGRSHDDPDN